MGEHEIYADCPRKCGMCGSQFYGMRLHCSGWCDLAAEVRARRAVRANVVGSVYLALALGGLGMLLVAFVAFVGG